MTRSILRKLAVSTWLACLLAGVPSLAQEPQEAGESAMHFAGLEEHADEVVKVNLRGRALEQAKKLLGLRKNVTGSVRSFVNGLTAVYRRTYRFRGGGAKREDVDRVHERLAEDGWVPLIETENRRRPDALAVYSYSAADGQVAGMTLVTSEPKEVTVLKILGPVDFEALSAIGSGMGLPVMRIATTELPPVAE